MPLATTLLERAATRIARAAVLAVAAATAPIVAPLGAQSPTVVDGINPYALPASTVFQVGSVGWAYTPAQSYLLGGILTRFSDTGTDRDVVVEVLDATRTTRLASATFNSAVARSEAGGGYFGSPLLLTAGTTYLIGFRKLGPVGDELDLDSYLGVNMAYFADAGGRLPSVWYGFDDTDPYAFEATSDDTEVETQPILQFVSTGGVVDVPTSTVPEPTTVALVATGLIVVAVGARRRRA